MCNWSQHISCINFSCSSLFWWRMLWKCKGRNNLQETMELTDVKPRLPGRASCCRPGLLSASASHWWGCRDLATTVPAAQFLPRWTAVRWRRTAPPERLGITASAPAAGWGRALSSRKRAARRHAGASMQGWLGGAQIHTCVEGEPAEAGLLLLGPALQDRLVEPHGILVVTMATVESHSQDFAATVDGSHAPHGHSCAQTVEVSAGQQVGPQKAGGGRAADVDPSGSAAAALRVMVLPRRPLENVQHSENPLLSVSLMQEESNSQRRVAWNSFGEIVHQPCG